MSGKASCFVLIFFFFFFFFLFLLFFQILLSLVRSNCVHMFIGCVDRGLRKFLFEKSFKFLKKKTCKKKKKNSNFFFYRTVFVQTFPMTQ